MFHIVLLAYVYVALMFSLAQDGWARGLIYFFIFVFFPVLLVLWVRGQKSRNRRSSAKADEIRPRQTQKIEKEQE